MKIANSRDGVVSYRTCHSKGHATSVTVNIFFVELRPQRFAAGHVERIMNDDCGFCGIGEGAVIAFAL
jgi:hypothetical protein